MDKAWEKQQQELKEVINKSKKVRFVLHKEPEGGYTVLCNKIPCLITYGDDIPQALEMAADAYHCIFDTGPYADPPTLRDWFRKLWRKRVEK